jgi:methylase of polypeptide subunit release factors
MKKSHTSSSKRRLTPDYPLQGSNLDLPLASVVVWSPEKRRAYIQRLLAALGREIKRDTMSLKRRKPFKDEMRDLRKLLRARADQFLYTDEKTYKRNVLGKGSYGSSHTFWSRHHMWKMKTRRGDLAEDIISKSPALIRILEKLLDHTNRSIEGFRNYRTTTVQNVLCFLQANRSVGAAFPPHHAKFFADRYLPKDGDGIVFDPCAGWGGRLLGSLCVNRTGHVHYYGVDPEKRNKDAYEGLTRRINVWLKRELTGKRSSTLYYRPFEVFIKTQAAKKLFGRCDLVITSPPYFQAEIYDPQNAKQSGNKYATYAQWRIQFYRPLMKGAFDLLKEGGVFVLNIANVESAKTLEKDARILAREVGFENEGFFKMALSISPGTRKAPRHSVVVNGKLFKQEPVFVFRRPAKNGAVSQSVTATSQRTLPTLAPKTVASSPTPKNTKEQLKEVFRRHKKSMRNPYALFSTRISAGLIDKTHIAAKRTDQSWRHSLLLNAK